MISAVQMLLLLS